MTLLTDEEFATALGDYAESLEKLRLDPEFVPGNENTKLISAYCDALAELDRVTGERAEAQRERDLHRNLYWQNRANRMEAECDEARAATKKLYDAIDALHGRIVRDLDWTDGSDNSPPEAAPETVLMLEKLFQFADSQAAILSAPDVLAVLGASPAVVALAAESNSQFAPTSSQKWEQARNEVVQAAQSFAAIERNRTPATEDSSIWLEAFWAARDAILAATDALAALESTPDAVANSAAASSKLGDGLFRVGNHQPRNVYRGDEYIGVMFDPADAAMVAAALNASPGSFLPSFPHGQTDERYPTVWAYEQACKAIVKHRDRADALNAAMGVIRDYANGSELSPFVQHVYQLAVDAIAADVDARNTMPPHPFVAMPASSVGSCAWCFRPEGYANHRTEPTPDGPGQTETGERAKWLTTGGYVVRACAVYRPMDLGGGYLCDLPEDHVGDHAAERNTIVWPRAAAVAVTEPGEASRG